MTEEQITSIIQRILRALSAEFDPGQPVQQQAPPKGEVQPEPEKRPVGRPRKETPAIGEGLADPPKVAPIEETPDQKRAKLDEALAQLVSADPRVAPYIHAVITKPLHECSDAEIANLIAGINDKAFFDAKSANYVKLATEYADQIRSLLKKTPQATDAVKAVIAKAQFGKLVDMLESGKLMRYKAEFDAVITANYAATDV